MSLSGNAVEKRCSKCNREFRTERDFMSKTNGWQYCSQGNLWFECSCGAQLMLTKGRFDWFSPTLLLSPTAVEVFKALTATTELPHMPSSIMELQRVLRDERATPQQLADAIKATPFLAVELLRLANNLKPPSGKPMVSLDHAIVFVGRKAVVDLARAASIKNFRFKTKIFSPDVFWKEAMHTAKIAEHIARTYAPHLSSDEAYIAGFLCNIGKVVGAVCRPDITDQIATIVSTGKQLPHWRKAETQFAGTDHCLLGEIGAVVWGLPAFVRDAAAKHHNAPRSRGRAALTAADVATFANQMTHWVSLFPHRIDEALLKQTALAFQVDDKALQVLADELIAAHKIQAAAADSVDKWLAEITGK